MVRLLLILAGFWLGMLVASWLMATANFRTVDRVLGPDARPEIATRLGGVPAEDRRVVLRHLVGEINRWMFRSWAFAQLALGGIVLAAAWRLSGWPRRLAGAALLLVVVQLAFLMPAIASAGRSIDFASRPLPPDVGRRFGMLHTAYAVADLAKAILVALAAWIVARRP
jgi:hypothetical protein